MNLTIPLHYLHEIFTGDSPPKVAGTTVLSRHPQVYEEVFLLRWELGALIQNLDTTESFFHVILYPSLDEAKLGKPVSHAELWTTQVWANSAAKQWRLKRPLTAEQTKRSARDEAYRAIYKELISLKIYTPVQAQAFADAIANNHCKQSPDGEFMDLTGVAVALKLDRIISELTDALTLETTN